MKKRTVALVIGAIVIAAYLVVALANVFSTTSEERILEGAITVTQKHGPILGLRTSSGVQLIYKGRKVFKDLDRDGELDVYEDWRKSPEKRAADLASKLSVLEMAGLMQASHMQCLPGTDVNHYDGKIFTESDAKPEDMTDEQKVFLAEDMVRSILLASVDSVATVIKWNNTIQEYVEGLGHGIPVQLYSDPRNGAKSDMIFQSGGCGDISRWPEYLGMAATFDPEVAHKFGEIAAQEYRAMGITMALSPQCDIPGEPRWWRFDGTFGEDPEMSAEFAREYCDGFQTSPRKESIEGAWGYGSVITMAKHWYGYGAQEGGREGHFAHGEYAVYPTDNLAMFEIPFAKGAFSLREGTKCTGAVMTNYSVLWNQDPSGANVGCSYSDYFIGKKLRGEYGFDGLVCTDWDVTYDCKGMSADGKGKPWGVENLSVAERHLKILEAGVDMFGGNNDSDPVVEAYSMWAAKYGEESARERFEQSARRILLGMFRTGIFENAYLDRDKTLATVGRSDFMAAGYEAQQKSVVVLKNSDVLPVAEGTKVYYPQRHYPETKGVWGGVTPSKYDWPADTALVGQYFTLVDSPEEADVAYVMIEGPALNIGYDYDDIAAGGNGYVPISLQYEDYTAVDAREVSIAGGNPLESFTNRSFKGKTVKTLNRDDMVLVQQTKAAMGGKPVVVVVRLTKPFVPAEIEPSADALVVNFGVQNQAILDVVSGRFEPQGRLPMQLPASMKTVEQQSEDRTGDMECYVDAAGNRYDFGFGLGWKGIIADK